MQGAGRDGRLVTEVGGIGNGVSGWGEGFSVGLIGAGGINDLSEGDGQGIIVGGGGGGGGGEEGIGDEIVV